MRENNNYVTQSKFFSPAFNAAIFDGPIRIYFAQYQEAMALKVYFGFQERFQHMRRERHQNIFVMLYPTVETFDLSFSLSGEGHEASPALTASEIRTERFGRDYVLGVRGPIQDADMNPLFEHLNTIVDHLKSVGDEARSNFQPSPVDL